ncbi:NYN domain-containing protein [Janthinobacterium sp. EB271-G4-7A]|uniref:NYN domain-containing protein n=1 Tax=Janthinobacterium sp. EB271-G4-7A TaxID=2775056 RepID=UPI001E4A94A4|nr:NYN domain-containing protein [Janthinobacterium sp. EB271-G4-7A]MCC7698224.1 NYN domain-containing protein [Janthinobacterium sp. EB271-G4-7A]
MASSPENLSMAVFCDFENVALGVRDANYEKFDIKPILERLLLKGSIVVKKAYCDWDRYKSFKGTMHEANFELIEIPHVRQSGKNSADIRLVVDALDLCYTKAHVNTFVIISGDSDFSPLVSKLRENAKQVIGVGVKQSTSDLLVANCDEFIFYDDLVRESRRTAAKRDARESPAAAAKRSPDEEVRRKEKYESRKTEAIEMAVETFDALVSERGDSGKIWASMLKEAIKRRKPDFSESYYGFRTFGNLLEEAQTRGLLEFGRDEKSGAYVYRSSGPVAVPAAVNGEAAGEAIVAGETGVTAEEGNQREGGSRRDSRRNGRGGRKQNEQRRGESAPQAFVPVADAETVVVDQYAPAPQPEVQHEVAEAAAETVTEVATEEGNAKRGSRRNGRGGRKNGDGGREARAEVVAVEVAPVVETMPEPVPEPVVEAKPKAKARTPARKAAAAKKPAKKAADVVVEAAPVVEVAPVEVAVVAEDKPAKAPRKTPARRPARKKAEEA